MRRALTTLQGPSKISTEIASARSFALQARLLPCGLHVSIRTAEGPAGGRTLSRPSSSLPLGLLLPRGPRISIRTASEFSSAPQRALLLSQGLHCRRPLAVAAVSPPVWFAAADADAGVQLFRAPLCWPCLPLLPAGNSRISALLKRETPWPNWLDSRAA